MKKVKLSEASLISILPDLGEVYVKSTEGINRIKSDNLVNSLKNKGYYSTTTFTGDLNSLQEPFEAIVASTAANAPVLGNGVIEVKLFNGSSQGRVKQVYTTVEGITYVRVKLSLGSWGTWKQSTLT